MRIDKTGGSRDEDQDVTDSDSRLLDDTALPTGRETEQLAPPLIAEIRSSHPPVPTSTTVLPDAT
ncbi:hypothetical protein GCM10009863_18900 [Streptomyces axinellae]|uniref:Uncharacterized protein n=1 Tax=Streptomyces axinellae TaxID=552788 RepID=A0ABP6CAP5_9ACTN